MQRQGSFAEVEYAGKKKQTRRDKFLARIIHEGHRLAGLSAGNLVVRCAAGIKTVGVR